MLHSERKGLAAHRLVSNEQLFMEALECQRPLSRIFKLSKMPAVVNSSSDVSCRTHIYMIYTDEELCIDAVLVQQQKAAREHQRTDESRSAPGAGRDA